MKTAPLSLILYLLISCTNIELKSKNEIVEVKIIEKNEKGPLDWDIDKYEIIDSDINKIPFFEIPSDYVYDVTERFDKETLCFWTGAGYEHPHGSIFQARIIPKDNQDFKIKNLILEFKNIFEQNKAHQIFEGRVPTIAINDCIEKLGKEKHLQFQNAMGFQGYAMTWVFLVRQKNNDIWIQLNESDDKMSLHLGILNEVK